ncbi:DUF1643 domain-containing protein [Bacillus inaquosorum]|uniref:DUF1643 domain-containing protein n=1 Tax=Bacillus inaquosorum TaxID=483913 RepID=UPI00227EFFAD|nr:DUF1643 domain-containing protein [Bacillus inaquosorum]MCY9084380.1 DUF1643 domain-containing protein [Bacillus inaquosorum]
MINYKHNETITGYEFDSICGKKIRYFLKIKLDNNNDKVCTFICKNPSHASEKESDQTVNIISDLIHTKKDCFGIGTIYIVNVFPFFDPVSKNLFSLLAHVKASQPVNYNIITEKNLETVVRISRESNNVIAAWGENPNGFPQKVYNQYIDNLQTELMSNGINTGSLNWQGRQLSDEGYYFHPGRKKVSDLIIKW